MRNKVGGKFSAWEESLTDAPQGVVLGPLLSTYILIISFTLQRTLTTVILLRLHILLHCSRFNLNQVMTDISILVEWFCGNYLTLKADKSHLIVLGNK